MKKGEISIYNKIVPEDSFIGKYLKMCSFLETPVMYDFWSAVWVLSGFYGRQVYIDRPNLPLFLNFYLIFLAESGIARKSTAVNTANSILSAITNNTMINSCTNVASFRSFLTQNSSDGIPNNININVSEFITFFKGKSILEFFTDMYDCPAIRQGYSGKQYYNFNNIYVNILAASTPSYYFSVLKGEQLDGGFMNRCIILPSIGKKRHIAWNVDYHKYRDAVLDTIKILKEKQPDHLIMNKSAIHLFKGIYRTQHNKNASGFNAREHDFALKLAGILALNRYSQVIDKKDIQNAYKVIRKQQNFLQVYMNQELYAPKADNLDIALEKIRNLLLYYKDVGIKQSQLTSKLQSLLTANQIHVVMTVLHELGLVDKFITRNGSTTIYMANKQTKDFDYSTLKEEISDKF